MPQVGAEGGGHTVQTAELEERRILEIRRLRKAARPRAQRTWSN